jgi:UDP-N-acetylglucosamine--N-acetylmuramyl-(pentapeptide) pyrophosphoryl-undecaprenol N-acetylglucosamine transferase
VCPGCLCQLAGGRHHFDDWVAGDYQYWGGNQFFADNRYPAAAAEFWRLVAGLYPNRHRGTFEHIAVHYSPVKKMAGEKVFEMRIMITGGGTGGHIYPALAIARGLREKYPAAEILYVGTAAGMEADIVPKAGYALKTVTVEGLPRKITPRALVTLGKLLKGIWQSLAVVRSFAPDVVIGTGGYVCGPVVLAAAICRRPTLIHEQNAYPGITNKLLARLVSRVMVSFPESVKYFPAQARITVTGLPVRPEILAAEREAGLKRLGLAGDKLTLLVFGGSRGARSINRAMVAAAKTFAGRPGLQVLHVTGTQGYEETLAELAAEGIALDKVGNIRVEPYLYNMQDALAAADMVVCRAGAATLAELTVLGRPAMLIPYPYAAENHQEYNARALVDRGAALLCKDSELNGQMLTKVVSELLEDRQALENMAAAAKAVGRPQALAEIIKCVAEVLAGPR